MKSPLSAIAVLITINVLWAASYSVVKFGLGSMHAAEIVFWRFSLSALILAAIVLVRRIPMRLPRRDLAHALGAGIFLGLSHWLWVTGINLSQAADASLLYAFEPVLGIILASLLLRERLRATTVVGLLLVIAGILKLSRIDLATLSFGTGQTAVGNLLIVGGIVCESLFSIVLKPVARRRSALLVTTIALAAASAILLLPLRGEISAIARWGTREALAIAYLVLICTVGGYTLWTRVMQNLPVGIMLFTIFVQPIAGALIAAATLGERLDARLLIGGALLLAGMGVAVIGHARARRATAALPVADPAVPLADIG